MQKHKKEILNFDKKTSGAIINEFQNCTLGQLAFNYCDKSMDEEGGIVGFDGKLNIRPSFQRNYVVDSNLNWKTKLVSSVVHSKPIGVFYFGWSDTTKESYILLDGQQRLITLCEFINDYITIPVARNGKVKECLFSQLTEDEQNRIRNYKPCIKIVTGSQEDILDWFITINQQITVLTDQELRNAAYNGPFTETVKRAFSRVRSTQKPTVHNYFVLSSDSDYCYWKYTNCKSPESCDVVEVALDWVSYDVYPEMRRDYTPDDRIRRYMSEHIADENADEVINHYKTVCEWVRNTFFVWQKSMKKVNWGRLYTEYHNNKYNLEDLNNMVDKLMNNEEITANSAVFEFVLLGCPKDKESMLVPRNFKERQKLKQFNLQGGLDPITLEPLCEEKGKKHYVAHHIIPFMVGGKTEEDNIILINPTTHLLIHSGCEYTPEVVKQLRDKLMDTVVNENKQ